MCPSRTRESFADPLEVFGAPDKSDKATAVRSTSFSACCDPVVSRKNFDLLNNTQVDKIVIDKSRIVALTATRVKLIKNGGTAQIQAFARNEVILAAGGVFTLHFLM